MKLLTVFAKLQILSDFIWGILAIGASSPCDERKQPTSCDGEYWWGSCFGNALDVVSPGVRMYTTDITGSAGYGSGNYI